MKNLKEQKHKHCQHNICDASRLLSCRKQLNIQITDTGTGITEQLQEKIFDAFYQGPAPEDSQIKGSGLGLTIVKELLMRLNGNISIISPVQSNMGTTINIRLPKAHEWRKSS